MAYMSLKWCNLCRIKIIISNLYYKIDRAVCWMENSAKRDDLATVK